MYMLFFSNVNRSPKREMQGANLQWVPFGEILREREHFSLKYRAILPSAVFETRKRTALHGEGFMWVPD